MEKHILNSVIIFKVPLTLAEFSKMSVACSCDIAKASEKVDLYLVSVAVEALEPLGVNIFLATVLIFFTELFIVREKVNISVLVTVPEAVRTAAPPTSVRCIRKTLSERYGFGLPVRIAVWGL